MLSRVVDLARAIADDADNIDVFVTTEDQRIADHAAEIGVECIITPDTCATGSDRVLAALEQRSQMPDYVLNLQGDAPFTPPSVVKAIIAAFESAPEVVTPVHPLTWDDLDRLRENKKTTPYSGTTAIVNAHDQAIWFSKNIIPAIRKEGDLRKSSPISPVLQHIGLYGYRVDILKRFCALQPGFYETLEGLEQLRLIENGISITAVKVDIDKGQIQSGIDTPEDLARANAVMQP